MRNLTTGASRLALALVCAISASACGMGPSGQKTGPVNATAERNVSRQLTSANPGQSAWRYEEGLARSNPQCGPATGYFELALRTAVDRFNSVVKNELPAPARYLTVTIAGDSMVDNISNAKAPGQLLVTLVCSSQRLEAYSYSRTVVMSKGLLLAIEHGAQAQAMLSEYPARLDDALNRIIDNAGGAESGGALSAVELARLKQSDRLRRDFQLTFFSAVAFVLYHELGHIVMEHVYKGQQGANSFMAPFDSLKEFQADSFAAVSMAPAGYSMRGADLVFSILAKLNPDGTSGHPPSWDRAVMARRAAQTGGLAMAPVYTTGNQ